MGGDGPHLAGRSPVINHSFPERPPLGTTITLDDAQSYVLVEAKPHQRRDGTMGSLLTWHTECAQCAMPFTFQTGLVISSLNRRCVKHKRPGQRVDRGKRTGHPLKVHIYEPSQ